MARHSCDYHIHRFLDAVERRELPAIGRCFGPRSHYANVPHPPAIGPDQITAMFAPILSRAERVRWDVVTSCYDGHRAFLERVDRFWIDGVEYAIECNGVYEVDLESEVIAEVRDYVDLGLWRERLAPAAIGGPQR